MAGIVQSVELPGGITLTGADAQNYGRTPASPAPTPGGTSGSSTPPAGTSEPTAGDVYNFSQPNYGNSGAITSAENAAAGFHSSGLSEADQSKIRSDVLTQFQGEIDAQNGIYAQKLAEAKVAGANRIGSNTALQASSGLLASNIGQGETAGIVSDNLSKEAGINAEKANAISNLIRLANTQADAAIKDKTNAKQAGLDTYITYLQNQGTRAEANVQKAAKAILASNLDLTAIHPDDLNKLARGYGISVDAIKAAYNELKPANDAAKLKAKQDAAKAAHDLQTTVAPGATVIGADGKPIYQAPAADKFTAAKAPDGSPLSFNSSNGKYYGTDGKEYKPATTPQGTGLLDEPSVSSFLKDKTPAQQAAFKSLPDVQKSDVMQLLNGDVLLSDLMTSRGVQGSAAKQQLLLQARAIDPNFSENVNKQRYAFQNEWNNANGKAYTIRNAINTGMGHLARLKELTDQLQNNGDFKKANSLQQWFQQNANGSDAETIAQFKDTVSLLASEIAKAYKGGVPDQAEVDRQFESLSSIAPRNVLTAIINNKVNLMSSLLNATAEEYKSTMGKYPNSPIVHPDALQELKNAGVDTTKITKSLVLQGAKATSVKDYETAFPDAKAKVDQLVKENPQYSEQDVLQILQPDFNNVGADTNPGSLKAALIQQESQGNYKAVGLATPHGNALGKYQIIPANLTLIGLDGNDPADRQKFLDNPQLQDQLFGKIYDHLSGAYNGDPVKIAAAYYGGPGGAQIVGTPAGDKKQYAGGKEMPSINEYVRQVTGRMV